MIWGNYPYSWPILDTLQTIKYLVNVENPIDTKRQKD
jgi:hypothetical protein